MSQLLEEILSRDNMMRAYKQVVANKGASGVDGIETCEVKQYLIENWEEIRMVVLLDLCREGVQLDLHDGPVLRVGEDHPDQRHDTGDARHDD